MKPETPVPFGERSLRRKFKIRAKFAIRAKSARFRQKAIRGNTLTAIARSWNAFNCEATSRDRALYAK